MLKKNINYAINYASVPPGPSGLVQQGRAAAVRVPKPPLVTSDSDSEEEEGLVSRLIPPSRLHQPSPGTKGIDTAQNTPEEVMRVGTCSHSGL